MDITTDFGSVILGSSPGRRTAAKAPKDRVFWGFCYTIVIMELSERYLQQLEKEGFARVYDDSDEPGTVYKPHSHRGKVTLWLTDGELKITIAGETKHYKAGDRINIPAGVEHSIVVGNQPLNYVVAEEIVGDA